MGKSWTEKYRPVNLEQVAAQGRAMKKIRKWADDWRENKPKKKALLFYGSPGTGKSATAAALAKEMDWDLIELNASDQRTRKEIERVAGSAASMGTLTGKGGKRLIILDEADNVHGQADRGGYGAISRLLDESQNPIILIGNDQYSIPRGIKNKSTKVNFRRLRKSSVAKVLRAIGRKEGINADEEALKYIAERSNGDLRSAINDFQTVAEGREEIRLEDVKTDERDRKIGIFKALGGLKKTREVQEARSILRDLDQTPEETEDWIDENLPRMMGNTPDLADAYEKLSRADIFLGRVRRSQNYGLWKYASDLMSAGIALSRKGKPGKGRFSYPSSRRVYGRSKKRRSTRDDLARKIAEEYHVSEGRAIKDFLPYLAVIFENDDDARVRISKELDLADDEVDYLLDL